MKAEVLEKVTARIRAGSSIHSFTQGGGYLVKFSTLARYRRENAAFDQLVNESISSRIYRASPLVAVGTFHYEWIPADLRAISAMLPDNFPGKNDAVQSILLALFEGRLDRGQVDRHVRWFVREYDRQHPTKYARFGDSPLVSLDEVLFEGRSATRGDMVSRGLWD